MSRPRLFKTLKVPSGHIVRTVEWIFRSAAATVAISLTGDFCSEQFPLVPLHKDDKGIWRIRLMLTPGRYRYQFVINGRWPDAPKNCGLRSCGGRGAVRVE